MDTPPRNFALFFKPLPRLFLEKGEIVPRQIEGPEPPPEFPGDEELPVNPEFWIADLHRSGFDINAMLLQSRDHPGSDLIRGHRPEEGFIGDR